MTQRNHTRSRGLHILKDVNYMPQNPYAVSDLKFAITPMKNGLRCAGTTELGGLNAKPSFSRVNILREGIKKVYPKLEWKDEEVWMGHRPTTPDCMPVLGKSETSNDIFFAFGGQHIGLTIGPKMGSIITNLILDIYKNDNWRLVKDTAGGYGTGNDFGNSIISKLINSLVSKITLSSVTSIPG